MGQTGLDQALWAFGRGSGITALIMLTVAVITGIGSRSGRTLLLPRLGLAELHRGAALIATALIAVHVVSLLADPYSQLRLLDTLVPFAGDYRPLWVGLGTVAVDLLAAIVVSALLRHRIGPNAFRVIHWAAYVFWPVALIHALGAGTDSGRLWMLAVAAACTLGVVAAMAWRISRDFAEFGLARERSLR
ncbi:ferric reductase-like transmembrane domain-containing protein [Nocardia sp. NBC_01327]|uniref:ferric reductase-like transmembrane domain-containing protein n=1 Tax=Nocardia sp. NBC_01327 TaxID=2903593 RepID=UPI002E0D7E9E|nr:ferric reductase-like transmembrane domain-containing protein [Nocardia sp. NBC_01327]